MDEITKNLVSVIVPTHNRAESLQQALLSIVKQSYSFIEIIVIANGCDEKTKTVVNEVQSSHKIPIIFLNFIEILGGAKARNIGMDKAKGEYIAFLDDDDTWHKDKLIHQIKLLQQKEVAIVGANGFYVNANNQYRQASKIKSHVGLKDLYYENILGGFSFCITKKCYLGKLRINENLHALQDWDLWFKILKSNSLPAYVSDLYLVYFRLNGNRISTNNQRVQQAQQLFLQNWQTDLDKRSIFYHQMRNTCLKIKLSNTDTIYRYFKHLPVIIIAIFFSPDRYNPKRYLHYLLLPITDIESYRAKITRKIK